MTLRKTGIILVIACLLMLVILPVSALVQVDPPAAPLVGVGVPNILQEKSKIQYTWQDFQRDAERDFNNENYEDSVKNYNKAEELLIAADPDRSSGTDYQLSLLEQGKGTSFAGWPGHDTEEKAAYQKADQLKASSKAKAEASGKGCLIVTATFGSPLAAEVQLVRNFRDGSIVKSYTGSRFMPGFNAWYYSFSPQVSTYINEHPSVKPGMQILITPILEIVLLSQFCFSFLSFNPELATVIAIIVGSALYSLIYVFPSTLFGMWLAKRRGWKGWDLGAMKPVLGVWAGIILLIGAGVAFSLDLLTTVASGLFVIATIVLVAGTLSLSLSRYFNRKSVAVRE